MTMSCKFLFPALLASFWIDLTPPHSDFFSVSGVITRPSKFANIAV